MKVLVLLILNIVFVSFFSIYADIPATKLTDEDDTLTLIEKVYIHADRDNYFPGDDIWFKAYLVNAADRFLTNHSMNLHVELISPALKIIDSRIVRIENGMGHGDFHLSEKLPSGKYRLRAYTNYMRNFGDQDFFRKDFNIINSTDAVRTFSDSVSYSVTRPDISFYPEGGSLVYNVPSIVAFKAVDQHGRSVDVSGEIITTEGDSVTGFKSTHNGMGIFRFQPLPGIKYFAVAGNPEGDTIRYELPRSFSTGIVMNIASNRDKKFAVIFRTNALTLPLLKEHNMTIQVSARGNPFKEYTFRMNSLNSLFTMPTDDLPDGIVMLTLSGVDDIPLCERLVYINNGDIASLKIETDKNEYSLRDSVSVKLALFIDSKTQQNAYLSFSATNDLFMNETGKYPSDIASWFLLESDIRGKIEEPAYYFDPSNTGRLKDLDLLLMTQGWRDFRWKYDGIKYPPEYGFKISGKIRKKFSDTPIENAKVNIGLFGNGIPLFRNMPTDESGHFETEDIDLTGNAIIIASTTDEKNKLKGWLILDSTSYASPEISETFDRANFIRVGDRQSGGISLPGFIQYSDFKTSLARKYKLSDTIRPGEVSITAKRQTSVEKARAESQYYLRSTWVDQSYEITPISKVYVNVGELLKRRFLLKPPRRFSSRSLNNSNPSGNQISNQKVMARKFNETVNQSGGGGGGVKIETIIMLNGVEVGWEGVESLPIEWIARVDYVKDRNAELIWGVRGMNGVVSVVLKDDLSDLKTNVVYHSARKTLTGFSEARIFYSPKHNTTFESDYKPDLRNTLFWDPDITLNDYKDTTIVFYNSDNQGTVLIKAEGITDKGIPVTGSKVYRVVR